MNDNDIKQLIIDTLRENSQGPAMSRPAPKPSSGQNRDPKRSDVGSGNFSKKIMIFISVLFAGSWGLGKVTWLMPELEAYPAEYKWPIAIIYGAITCFYQISSAIEKQNAGNASNEQSTDESNIYDDFS